MFKRLKTLSFGCAFILGFHFSTPAALAASDDVLITDPDLLEAMGFARDMDKVYMAAGIELSNNADSMDAGLWSSGSPSVQPELFPSGSTDYSPVSAKEFFGRVDSTGTQWQFSAGNSLELSRLGTERFADAQVEDLPNGGVLQFFRWWWSDNDPNSAMGIFLFEVCQPSFGGGAVTFTTVATSTSFDTANGSAVVVIPNRPIDTQSCYYLVRVRFDAATSLLRFQKARLQFTHP
ncbi:hypothetical protein [Microbulbifer discodermiae]|uniref:hypothetical protein n=1 Tax=Microbulbifer sp. 2201CG32-9 TaxID=3232309 RepID=UPI00345BC863